MNPQGALAVPRAVVGNHCSNHRYLLEEIAYHLNKSTADQLAMQIRKLALGL